MENKTQNLFKGQKFYLTSNPLIRVATDDGKPVIGVTSPIPVSEAVTLCGGEVVPSFDKATCTVISPSKEVDIDSLVKKPVYGSRYIADSIILSKPLKHAENEQLEATPEPAEAHSGKPSKDRVYWPILCRAFEDTKVTIYPKIQSASKEYLEAILMLMGHSNSNKKTEGVPKYFVTDTANSDECYNAVVGGMKPVKATWIIDSFLMQERMPLLSEYVVKPFEKCVICVTGFFLVSRQIIQQIVVSMGGVFSPEFSRKCTHLIAYNTASPKFKASQYWKIPAVKLDWLFLAVNANTCPPTTNFIVQPVPIYMPPNQISLPPSSAAPSFISQRSFFYSRQQGATKRNDGMPSLQNPPSKKQKPDDGKGDNGKGDNGNASSNGNNDNSKKPSGDDGANKK